MAGSAGEGPGRRAPWRWAVLAGLLAAELGLLTVLGDLPTIGPLGQLVSTLRMGMAVALASAVTAWMLLRAVETSPEPLPPWRPWPWLLAHAAAFLPVALLTPRLFGPGAAPPTGGRVAPWLALLAGATVLALRSAVPFGWLGRRLGRTWGVPVVALAAGLASWRVMAASEALWGRMADGTLRAVAWLLRLVSAEVIVDLPERVIGLGAFEVEIAQHCAGIDGVGLTLVFQSIWIGLAHGRLRLGRALLLLPAGAAVALAGNVLRIAGLVWLGGNGHEELAVGAFHSKVGWLLFTAIALASVAATEHLDWLRRPQALAAGGGMPAAAGPWVAPLLASLATAMAMEVVGAGTGPMAYGLRVAAPLLVLAGVRRWWPRPLVGRSGLAALLGLGAGVLWVVAHRAEPALPPPWLADLSLPARGAWIAVRLLGSTLVIPVAEELAFRGFLLSWLAPHGEGSGRDFGLPAALLSSLAFGALHAGWWQGTLAGLAFALALRLRGRLGDAILAHMVANGVVALAVLAGGRWDLWR
ncbi:MAG: exosortase E/protease, VPEID-CTERM system [Deltaproteobacteria bacterium]|nr:exosortase E/protease, VPEID-CTERM system [Deltaproteobacteria bacterium]